MADRDRWERVPLANVCDVIQGQSPPGDTYNGEGRGLPFFQGKAEFGEIYPTATKWCSAPKKIAEPGDVLVSIRAPVGPTNLARERAAIGRGLAALRPYPGVPSKYLLYAMRASEDGLRRVATGTTFEAVRGARLRAHTIALAPLDQRDGIVSFVEAQLALIGAGEDALKRATDGVKQLQRAAIARALAAKLVPTEAELARGESRLYETGATLVLRIAKSRESARRSGRGSASPPTDALAEGWTWAQWDEVGSSRNGRAFPSADYSTEGVKLLRPGNLHASGHVAWNAENTRFLPSKWETAAPDLIVGPSELVMNLTAQSLKDEFLGRICMTGAGDRALLNQRLARLTPNTARSPLCLLGVQVAAVPAVR